MLSWLSLRWVGHVRNDRVGVWVERPGGPPGIEDKIAAIGVRLSRWISMHGFSINVAPSLDAFSGIVPCGITEFGVTSLENLGHAHSMALVDDCLVEVFREMCGPIRPIRLDFAADNSSGP